ncbi:MAG: lysophospholipase [Mediterranea sp.]|jgi:fermentation-respiration switch protein FrsA (DUF1100 family)|nr:lysophospholipase [Mediterranea sp.]
MKMTTSIASMTLLFAACLAFAPAVAAQQITGTERAIVVQTGAFKLPGILTLPAMAGKVPVVILVHGSGPNDRDETIGPNKPFRDLANGLAEHGIATIRYDKRTKVYGAASVPQGTDISYDTETVDDALSAVELARTLPEINPQKVFVLGHSLGGMLAPRIAKRSGHLAGIIMLAAAARPMETILREQLAYLAPLQGFPESAIPTIVEQTRKSVPASYWTFANEYQPAQVAALLSIPMLILQGERDYQVTMEDFHIFQTALSGHHNAQFRSYPKLNHLFQVGEGKAVPQEYMKATPVAPIVVQDIARFVKAKK